MLNSSQLYSQPENLAKTCPNFYFRAARGTWGTVSSRNSSSGAPASKRGARGGGQGTQLRALVARPGGGAALNFEVAPRGFWQVNDKGTDALVQLVSDGVAQGLAVRKRAAPRA